MHRQHPCRCLCRLCISHVRLNHGNITLNGQQQRPGFVVQDRRSGFSYYAYWKYATNVPAGTTQIRFEYLRGGSYTGDACFTLVKITCGSRITTPKPPAPLPPPSAPLGCLPDTCFYKFDGVCDDGGEGAEYSSCAGGTDCYDCGPRLSPPPSYPPVPPLPAVNSFPLIVPLLEMKLIMIMPPGDPSTPATGTWASLLQDPIFALNFQNGLQSLFNCREPPYCETEIKATNQVDLSWQVACNRTINVTATSGDAPVDTGANSSNWCDRTVQSSPSGQHGDTLKSLSFVRRQRPTRLQVLRFRPPPPPSPWYDKVNGGMNPKTMEDNFVRAQLRLYKMSPPSPPPPSSSRLLLKEPARCDYSKCYQGRQSLGGKQDYRRVGGSPIRRIGRVSGSIVAHGYTGQWRRILHLAGHHDATVCASASARAICAAAASRSTRPPGPSARPMLRHLQRQRPGHTKRMR